MAKIILELTEPQATTLLTVLHETVDLGGWVEERWLLRRVLEKLELKRYEVLCRKSKKNR